MCQNSFSGFVWMMLFAALPSSARPDEPCIAYGTVVDGRFLSFVEEGIEGLTGATWYCGDLSSSQVHTLRSVLPHKVDYFSKMLVFSGRLNPAPFGPRRWRVRSGLLWACFMHSAGSSLLENFSFFQMEFSWDRGWKIDCPRPGEDVVTMDRKSWQNTATQERPLRSPGRSLQHIVSGNMLGGIRLREIIRENEPTFFEYDFVPLSPRSLQLFLQLRHMIEVWQYDFKPGRLQEHDVDGKPTRKRDVWLGTWTLQSKFPAKCHEPFHVTEVPSGVAFVTASGRSYVAEKDADDQWSSRAVWDDESRPLIAMVDVPDQKQCYAFGKDFYFLLTNKPESVECRDVTLHRTAHGEPLRTSWECAKVLYEDGKVVISREEPSITGQ